MSFTRNTSLAGVSWFDSGESMNAKRIIRTCIITSILLTQRGLSFVDLSEIARRTANQTKTTSSPVSKIPKLQGDMQWMKPVSIEESAHTRHILGFADLIARRVPGLSSLLTCASLRIASPFRGYAARWRGVPSAVDRVLIPGHPVTFAGLRHLTHRALVSGIQADRHGGFACMPRGGALT